MLADVLTLNWQQRVPDVPELGSTNCYVGYFPETSYPNGNITNIIPVKD